MNAYGIFLKNGARISADELTVDQLGTTAKDDYTLEVQLVDDDNTRLSMFSTGEVDMISSVPSEKHVNKRKQVCIIQYLRSPTSCGENPG